MPWTKTGRSPGIHSAGDVVGIAAHHDLAGSGRAAHPARPLPQGVGAAGAGMRVGGAAASGVERGSAGGGGLLRELAGALAGDHRPVAGAIFVGP
jgi:hypothetical protein